jgi:hypothetical protein
VTVKNKLVLYCYDKQLSPYTVLENVNAILDKESNSINIDLLKKIQKLLFRINRKILDIFKTTKLTIPINFFFSLPSNLEKYDIIIIHSSLSYDPILLEMILLWIVRHKKKNTKIVLFKQDEIFKINYFCDLINKYKISLLFSVAPTKLIANTLYSQINNTKIFNVLTGYVSTELRNYKVISNDSNNRKIDICYRGMKLPYWFGKLGYQKYEIGEKFKEICKKYNLKSDISSYHNDRIYGSKWLDFLSNSKAVLAVESGSSIIDFDGEITKSIRKYIKKYPHAGFDKTYNDILIKYDNKIKYRAISPRLFEAGATKTALIMMEGEYQNIFKPNIHYIPVKEDYSNIEEVIKKLNDIEFRKFITENVYQDIILNDDYSYDEFRSIIYKHIKKVALL